MSDEPRDNATGDGNTPHGSNGDGLSSSHASDGGSHSQLAGSFEHHEVTPEQRKRRQARSRASMTTAIALFVAALIVVVAVLGSTFGLFERKGNVDLIPSLVAGTTGEHFRVGDFGISTVSRIFVFPSNLDCAYSVSEKCFRDSWGTADWLANCWEDTQALKRRWSRSGEIKRDWGAGERT